MIYWFTGQPGAGKTTISKLLIDKLRDFHPVSVDGDDIREIFKNKDYSESGRKRNIELAQNIAHFIHKKGGIAVVSLVSPFREQREEFKKLIGDNFIKEIYVHTKDIRGREGFHVSDYEQPLENFIEIDTTNKTEIKSVIELIQKLGL